jgi:POTRA domain, FtsQ-type
VLAAALAAGFAWLLQGPWLRVSSATWSGARYTSAEQVAAILAPLRGSSLLTLDDAAVAAQVASLPAVQSATVEPTLPGGISVAIQEKVPALVWQTSAVRLLVADDGVVFGDLSLSTPLPAALARLPLIDDRRDTSLDFFIGDRIPDAERSIALRLSAINPVALGSTAKGLRVRLDDQCGYVISPSSGASWSAAIGLSGMDPNSAAMSAGIDARVAAVRTLFAAHSERGIRWVDARNPGKVYWRANGPGGSDAC